MYLLSTVPGNASAPKSSFWCHKQMLPDDNLVLGVMLDHVVNSA